jgi:hypothetical protein
MSRSLVTIRVVMSLRVLRIGDSKAHSLERNWMALEALCLPLETPSLHYLQLEDEGLVNILPVYVTMS